MATTLGWGGAHELRGRDPGVTEPLPEGTGFTAAGPGVIIEAEELDALDVFHGLAWQLSQRVVEEVKDGQATQISEGPAVDLPDAVFMNKEAVQVDQASEHVLREGTDAVSMQEEMGEVDQIREQVILQKVELILLEETKNTRRYSAVENHVGKLRLFGLIADGKKGQQLLSCTIKANFTALQRDAKGICSLLETKVEFISVSDYYELLPL